MLIAKWLALFVIGWASGRWRSVLVIAPAVAAVTTMLCFITTNSPAFTAVEQHLSLTASSLALNFLAKLIYAVLFFSAGYACKRAMARVRHGSAKRVIESPAATEH